MVFQSILFNWDVWQSCVEAGMLFRAWIKIRSGSSAEQNLAEVCVVLGMYMFIYWFIKVTCITNIIHTHIYIYKIVQYTEIPSPFSRLICHIYQILTRKSNTHNWLLFHFWFSFVPNQFNKNSHLLGTLLHSIDTFVSSHWAIDISKGKRTISAVERDTGMWIWSWSFCGHNPGENQVMTTVRSVLHNQGATGAWIHKDL